MEQRGHLKYPTTIRVASSTSVRTIFSDSISACFSSVLCATAVAMIESCDILFDGCERNHLARALPSLIAQLVPPMEMEFNCLM